MNWHSIHKGWQYSDCTGNCLHVMETTNLSTSTSLLDEKCTVFLQCSTYNVITLLMITRPTKLYMANSATTSPQSPVEPSAVKKVPLERAPHSIDLDITLEDKDKVRVNMSIYLHRINKCRMNLRVI